MNKEEIARREGMAYAFKIAKEKGVDALEEEIKFRNATKIPTSVNRKVCNDVIEKIKNNTIDTVLIMSVAVLHDEFGFGTKRLKQFMDRFNLKTDCLCDGYVTWQDFIDDISANLGLELTIRRNE